MKYCTPKYLLPILPIIIIIGGYLIFIEVKNTQETVHINEPSIKINNTVIAVELAVDPAEQWQGLSDRKNLGPNNGMLFVFPDYQKRTFVMRRMHFPLDIIWIKDDKIVGIAKNLPSENENPDKLYSSPLPINYVLEVNGGFCDVFNIKVGDTVEFYA
ncbi:DUF192 domain-containing protein [Candidatus Parcubacteria bacterium]|nr:DUF192 domain-containing protein [Candidatus Parcubacteria bacterium]